MRSVFELSQSDEVARGKFLLKTDEDFVAVSLHPDFFNEIRIVEGSKDGKLKLLAGLFVPAVMQLLTELKEDPTISERLKWASVLNQKCRDLNLDLDDIQSYVNFAQDLLKMPLEKLITSGSGD